MALREREPARDTICAAADAERLSGNARRTLRRPHAKASLWPRPVSATLQPVGSATGCAARPTP